MDLEKETISDAAKFSRNVVLQAGSGKAVLAMDTGQDERLRELKSVSMYGIRSVLCVPLQVRDRIIGVIYVDNRIRAGMFSRADLELLTAIAAFTVDLSLPAIPAMAEALSSSLSRSQPTVSACRG